MIKELIRLKEKNISHLYNLLKQTTKKEEKEEIKTRISILESQVNNLVIML